MEERIKDIVATFLRIPAAQIGPNTRIDRPALQSSILLHRMYARLEEQGFRFENYTGIQVFGDLLRQQQITGQPAAGTGAALTAPSVPIRDLSEDAGLIGIDIQDIQALPRTDDFRKESFYRMNFAPSEIAYCILQPDPYDSFGGLFAAKEAIIKADGTRRALPFNALEIGHTAEGVPVTSDFRLSISHAGGFAVAVAVSKMAPPMGEQATKPALIPPPAGRARGMYAAWTALALALLSILLVLWRQK
jgi:phosphopantetheine--protein transferase-like protein